MGKQNKNQIKQIYSQLTTRTNSTMKLLAIFATFTAFASAGKLPAVALKPNTEKQLTNLANNAQSKLENKLKAYEIDLNLDTKIKNVKNSSTPQLKKMEKQATAQHDKFIKNYGNKNVNGIIGDLASQANGLMNANKPQGELASTLFNIGKDLFNAGVKAGQEQVVANNMNRKVKVLEKGIVQQVNGMINGKV